MAEFMQRTNHEENEHSGRGKNRLKAPGRQTPEVNFDEMNFEQRRAPYNSGNRNIAEREYNTVRDTKHPD